MFATCPNCSKNIRTANGWAFHSAWCKPAQPVAETVRTVSIHADAVTQVRAPITTVLHLTDARADGPVPALLGRSDWFTDADAIAYAREQSTAHPEPQRFAVYAPDGTWLGSWQSGREIGAFVVEPEPAEQAPDPEPDPTPTPTHKAPATRKAAPKGHKAVAGPHYVGSWRKCPVCRDATPAPVGPMRPERVFSMAEPTRPEPNPILPAVWRIADAETAYAEAKYGPGPDSLRGKYSIHHTARTLELEKVRPVFDPEATDPLGPWSAYGPAAPVRDRERVKHVAFAGYRPVADPLASAQRPPSAGLVRGIGRPVGHALAVPLRERAGILARASFADGGTRDLAA